MELIYLGFFLFIVGVAGTLIYDALKDAKRIQKEEREAIQARRSQAPLAPKKRVSKTSQTSTSLSIEEMIKQVQERAIRGDKTVKVNSASTNETKTYDVQELIAKLENMKKNL